MNFTLIANNIQSTLPSPIEIGHGYRIRLATEQEWVFIKLYCDKQIKSYSFGIRNPFEMKRQGNAFLNLARDEYKYWVIEHDRNQIPNEHISIFALLNKSIYPIYSFQQQGQTTNYSCSMPGFSYSRIQEFSHNFWPTEFEQTDIKLLNQLFEAFDNLNAERHNFIINAIEDYRTLFHIPFHSNLKTIGYMSLIEKIITSRKSLQINSINFQLQNKLNLINNRSDNRIDLLSRTNPTDKTNSQKVIELLYSYRSNIAHGEISDFDDKLQILGDEFEANSLIKDLCKMTIIQSIFEPDLLIDLRTC